MELLCTAVHETSRYKKTLPMQRFVNALSVVHTPRPEGCSARPCKDRCVMLMLGRVSSERAFDSIYSFWALS